MVTSIVIARSVCDEAIQSDPHPAARLDRHAAERRLAMTNFVATSRQLV